VSRTRVNALIDDGTIHGGMLPKVRACLAALASGAHAACIADGRDRAALLPLVDGDQPSGTVVTALDGNVD
jgi:acetylglutamate kinase